MNYCVQFYAVLYCLMSEGSRERRAERSRARQCAQCAPAGRVGAARAAPATVARRRGRRALSLRLLLRRAAVFWRRRVCSSV